MLGIASARRGWLSAPSGRSTTRRCRKAWSSTQDPPAGTEERRKTPVSFVVSKGPEPLPPPEPDTQPETIPPPPSSTGGGES